MNIATPVPAATLLLLKDTENGPQAFMQQRSYDASFVGGAYVFPGGKLDFEDKDFPDEYLCLPAQNEQRFLFQKPMAKANAVAALRECFEEAGVLLAYDQDQKLLNLNDIELAKKYEQLRGELNAGKLSFVDLCRTQQIKLAFDQLVFFGHWVTPESSSQRFDTLFFACAMPENQSGSHDDYESIESVWWVADEALSKNDQGEIQLITPTRRSLEHLSTFASSDDFLSHHRQGLSVLGR